MDLANARSALRCLARRQHSLAAPAWLAALFEPATAPPPACPLPAASPVVPATPPHAQLMEGLAQMALCEMDWAPRAVSLVCLGELLARGVVSSEEVAPLVLANLEHPEHRVRNVCARVIGQLAALDGRQTWNDFGPRLLELIDKSLALQEEERGIEAERLGLAETCSLPAMEPETSICDCQLPAELVVKRTALFSVVDWAPPPLERLRAGSSNASARYRADSGAMVLMVHETMGWKALESSIKALTELVQGYGPSFCPPPQLVNVLADKLLGHENRFSRELGFELCASLGATQLDLSTEVARLLALVAVGLVDAWNQVRMAALKAVKALLTPARLPQIDSGVLDSVLPALVFNRHNVADGVRPAAQNAWTSIVGSQGAALMSQRIDAALRFFVAKSASKMDGDREAACRCLAELVLVVPGAERCLDAVLDALLPRLNDGSWSVRSAACSASAHVLEKHFFSPRISSAFVGPWLAQVSDPVWSVREESAVAVGRVARLAPQIQPQVLSECQRGLAVAREEAVSRAHHHHHHHHQQQQHSGAPAIEAVDRPMFSCCAPTPTEGARLPSEPWHAADGALYLIREMARLQPVKTMELLPAAVELLALDNPALSETLYKILPDVARAVGKRPFKTVAGPLLVHAVQDVQDRDRARRACEAAHLLVFLRGFLGEEIFRARVLECLDGSRMMQVIDREESKPESFARRRVGFAE